MSDDDLYDLADDASKAKSPATTPFKAGEGAVAPDRNPSINPISYKHPQTQGTNPGEDDFPDRAKDLYLPLGLIGGGLVIEIVAAFIRTWAINLSWTLRKFVPVMTTMGLRIVLDTAFLLVALAIAARFRGVKLGRLPIAITKLCAVSIGPGAIMTLLYPAARWIPIIGALGLWVFGFALYFAFLGAMFDLDQEDTWYCVCVIFVVKLGVAFALRPFI